MRARRHGTRTSDGQFNQCEQCYVRAYGLFQKGDDAETALTPCLGQVIPKKRRKDDAENVTVAVYRKAGSNEVYMGEHPIPQQRRWRTMGGLLTSPGPMTE